MKLWDKLLRILFPPNSVISTVILVLLKIFGIIFPVLASIPHTSIPTFVFVIYGACMIFLGLVLYSLNQNKMQKRLKAVATVIDSVEEVDSSEEGGPQIFYSPILQFIDSRTGEEVTAHYTFVGAYSTRFHRIGKTYNILYDPEEPTRDVRVESFWHGPVVFIGIAVFGGLVSLIYSLFMLGILR